MDRRNHNCIFGCDIIGISLHKFPNPEKHPDVFADWVAIVGDKLKEKDPMKIFRNKHLCGRHFEASQKSVGHRLFPSSRPTLNLMCVPKSLVTLVQLEHNYYCPAAPPTTIASTSNMPTSCCVTSVPKDLELWQEISISPTSMEDRRAHLNLPRDVEPMSSTLLSHAHENSVKIFLKRMITNYKLWLKKYVMFVESIS